MPILVSYKVYRGNDKRTEKVYFRDMTAANKFVEGLDEGEDIEFSEVKMSEVK